jgi:hypothetical protein
MTDRFEGLAVVIALAVAVLVAMGAASGRPFSSARTVERIRLKRRHRHRAANATWGVV